MRTLLIAGAIYFLFFKDNDAKASTTGGAHEGAAGGQAPPAPKSDFQTGADLLGKFIDAAGKVLDNKTSSVKESV